MSIVLAPVGVDALAKEALAVEQADRDERQGVAQAHAGLHCARILVPIGEAEHARIERGRAQGDRRACGERAAPVDSARRATRAEEVGH